jgi:hypothetical protein
MKTINELRRLWNQTHDLRVLFWAWACLRELYLGHREATIHPLSPEVGAIVVRRLEMQDRMQTLFPRIKGAA